LVVPVWMPGTGKIRAGGLLVGQQVGGRADACGRRTWGDFLTERLS
jgi:hypothetical protein